VPLRASLLSHVLELERVDSEAFHITNDEHWLFWDFTRAVATRLGQPVLKSGGDCSCSEDCGAFDGSFGGADRLDPFVGKEAIEYDCRGYQVQYYYQDG
jgi:hypothetical protein